MKTIVYPGTFDPIHNGHLDIAFRAASLFDKLIFVVAENRDKSPLFSVKERMEMIKQSTSHVENIDVSSSSDLIVNFASKEKAVALIRGLRHVSDFEFEFQLAMMNYHLNPDIITIFMMPDEKFIHINSNVIKDVSMRKGDITPYVPSNVEEYLNQKRELL
jgi:pantetheine-phosphate adenylyltransferase